MVLLSSSIILSIKLASLQHFNYVTIISILSSRNYCSCACSRWTQEHKFSVSLKPCATNRKEGLVQLEEEPVNSDQNKGSMAGAVALVIGTSIGSGILALPQKASPAVKQALSFPLSFSPDVLAMLNSALHCRGSFQVHYPW